MGQYYNVAVLEENGNLIRITPCSGLKLMEHSYIGTGVTNAVLSWIWRNPSKIAWVGDYSDDPYEGAYSEKIDKEKFMLIYNSIWGKDRIEAGNPLATHTLSFRMKNRFLVNHTQKRYIDLGRYMQENFYMETYRTRNGKHQKFKEAIHPLPLLTACGNDCHSRDGCGGDFYEWNIGYELVGTWAFDLLEYTDRRPGTDFEEQVVHFSERRS